MDALRRLKAGGLLADLAGSNDPFRGRKVLTRYEFASLLARLLAQVEAAQVEAENPSPQEEIVRALTEEFRAELQLMGIRLDAFDTRLKLQETQVRNLEERRSNIKMEGFYRVQGHFVNQPVNMQNYRFTFEEAPFLDPQFQERGLLPFEHEVFLRLIGRASAGNKLAVGMEAFAELRAVVNGIQENVLEYRYADQPVVGDSGTDSFATGVIDNKSVKLNRGHFIAQTDFMDFRLFANEAATEPGDPSRLFAIDPGRPPGTDPRQRVVDPFIAWSGVEAGGQVGKVSYFGSVLSQQEELFFGANSNRYNLFNPTTLDTRDALDAQFTPARINQVDNYAARVTYEPYRYLEGSGKEMTLGLTYNEVAFGYDSKWDRNTVYQLDFQYARTRQEDALDYTVAALWSEGRGDVEDAAYRMDARYRRGGLLALFKGYYYGHGFQALAAQDPFVDADINFNFRRTLAGQPGPDTQGERLFRTQLRYNFDPAGLTTLDDLSLELLYEVKAFDRDPLNLRENDHEVGSRFYLQGIADIDSRIHVELRTEVQKDIPQVDTDGSLLEEEGALINSVRVDYRPLRKVGLSGEMAFIDDFDNRDEDGTHFQFRRLRSEVNVQPSPAVFLKGTFEGIDNSDLALGGLPRRLQNGRDLHRFIGEAAFTLRNNFGIKGLFVNQRTDNTGTTSLGTTTGGPPPGEAESNLSQIFQAEANWQISRALKFRYVYGMQDTNLDFSDDEILGTVLDDFVNVNHFFQFQYRPTQATEILLTYGDEYENPRDPLDNGPAGFHRTAKVYSLSAQTNF